MPDTRETQTHETQRHEGGVPLITLVLSGALSVGQLSPLEGPARALEVARK